MSRRLVALDRFACLVLALALVAAGLFGLDWAYRLVFDYPDAIDLEPALDLTTTPWWAWATGCAGAVLVALGLWWLLSHARRTTPSTLRLPDSDPTGALQVDLSSVADTLAKAFEAGTPVSDVQGSTRSIGPRHVIELTGHVDARAEGNSISEAAREIIDQLHEAFPPDGVHCRIILNKPRARGLVRPARSTARVH